MTRPSETLTDEGRPGPRTVDLDEEVKHGEFCGVVAPLVTLVGSILLSSLTGLVISTSPFTLTDCDVSCNVHEWESF